HDRLLHLSGPGVAVGTALRSMLLLEAGGPAQTQAIHKVPGGCGGRGGGGTRARGVCAGSTRGVFAQGGIQGPDQTKNREELRTESGELSWHMASHSLITHVVDGTTPRSVHIAEHGECLAITGRGNGRWDGGELEMT